MKPDLAILYEHPTWFEPLFAALDRRGLRYEAIRLSDHGFDPASTEIPAPVVLSRVAMSSFLREAEHGIFYAEALLDHWAANGARVLNGAGVIAVDSSKARQLSLIARLGCAVPETRVVHRREDLPAAARTMRWPLLVKANLGGSGAGIVRYPSEAALAASLADGSVPMSVDSVLLVQELCARPRRDDRPGRDPGRPVPLRDRGGERRRQLRPLPRRRLPGPAGPGGGADDCGDSAARVGRGGGTDRPGGGARRRRSRISGRRPRRRGPILRHQRFVQLRREAAGRARLGPARPAGRLSRSGDRGRANDAVRLLDAGLRRLASQRRGRGDGGELGLCPTAHPEERGDRLGPDPDRRAQPQRHQGGRGAGARRLVDGGGAGGGDRHGSS